MLTLQQLIDYLHSGERQLEAYRLFRNGFESTEFYLQSVEDQFVASPYNETLVVLLKWIDWFITETGYEEGVLIHKAEYLHRRIQQYPAIELQIEQRTRELHARLAHNQQQHNES